MCKIGNKLSKFRGLSTWGMILAGILFCAGAITLMGLATLL